MDGEHLALKVNGYYCATSEERKLLSARLKPLLKEKKAKPKKTEKKEEAPKKFYELKDYLGKSAPTKGKHPLTFKKETKALLANFFDRSVKEVVGNMEALVRSNGDLSAFKSMDSITGFILNVADRYTHLHNKLVFTDQLRDGVAVKIPVGSYATIVVQIHKALSEAYDIMLNILGRNLFAVYQTKHNSKVSEVTLADQLFAIALMVDKVALIDEFINQSASVVKPPVHVEPIDPTKLASLPLTFEGFYVPPPVPAAAVAAVTTIVPDSNGVATSGDTSALSQALASMTLPAH